MLLHSVNIYCLKLIDKNYAMNGMNMNIFGRNAMSSVTVKRYEYPHILRNTVNNHNFLIFFKVLNMLLCVNLSKEYVLDHL